VVEFSRSGQEETEQGRLRVKKTGTFAMMFNGSLIENLIAAVERAEQRAQSIEPMFAEDLADEPWFASGHESTDNESKLLGVA
jgi:hypothetical protein